MVLGGNSSSRLRILRQRLIRKKIKSPWYDKNDEKYIANVTAPCTDMCPSHVDIPGYIEGVRDLNYENSLKSTRQTMPLAHVCGRVCPHPCEDACRRANLDEAVSIMELKRIGADYETDHHLEWFHPRKPKKPRNDGKKIADDMISGYTTLNDNISETIDLIKSVETASKEQKTGIEQINDTVTTLDRVTQENAHEANHVAKIAAQLRKLANGLLEDAKSKKF